MTARSLLTMTSYQEKNSTIVLFPKVFDGTTYEGIINWMNERRVGELNFLSASKVGGQPVLKMHDIHQTEVLGEMRNTHYSVPIVNRNGINFSPSNNVSFIISTNIFTNPL